MDSLPDNVPLLIELLDLHFPARPARPGKSLDQLMFEAGQRSVVDLLIRLRDQRSEESLR